MTSSDAPEIQTGNPVSFEYAFDAAAPDGNPQNPGEGLYEAGDNGALVFRVETAAGELTLDCGSVRIGVLNDYPVDPGDAYGVFGFDCADFPVLQLFFSDPTGQAVGSDALLLEPPDLAAWPNALFQLSRQGAPLEQLFVNGEITAVPEPRRALLLAAGIATAAVLGAGRRPDPRRVAR